jgi:hypothetical protein
VRSIPAIQQRRVMQSHIGRLGPRVICRRGQPPGPAAGPCDQLGDNDECAFADFGHLLIIDRAALLRDSSIDEFDVHRSGRYGVAGRLLGRTRFPAT